MRVLNITYNSHLQDRGEANQDAVDWIAGLSTCEVDVEEELFSLKDHNYIDSINGIDVWYNWRADYYAFTEEEVENG